LLQIPCRRSQVQRREITVAICSHGRLVSLGGVFEQTIVAEAAEMPPTCGKPRSRRGGTAQLAPGPGGFRKNRSAALGVNIALGSRVGKSALVN
jgi:hypothetical protein